MIVQKTQPCLLDKKMTPENSLNQFLNLANDWSAGYTHVMRTYLAFRRSGEWHLEYSAILFVTDFFEEVDKLNIPADVETETILAVKEVVRLRKSHVRDLLNPKTFDPFFSPHNKHSISVPTEARSNLSYYYEPLTPRELPGNWRFPRLTANSGSNLTNLHLPHRDKLDLELMGHKFPYSDIEDLFDTFGSVRPVKGVDQTG